MKDEASSKEVCCSFACSSMYLGALIKSLKLDLFKPCTVPPFAGHSMISLDDAILEIRQLPFDKFCPQSELTRSYCDDLRVKARDIVNDQFMKIKGLELKELIDPLE